MIDHSTTLNWPGLQSLDLGSAISPDGRDNPLVPYMPVILGAPASSSDATTTDTSSSTSTASLPGLPSLPQHFGARLAVGVIAIIVIGVVLWRILAPPLV